MKYALCACLTALMMMVTISCHQKDSAADPSNRTDEQLSNWLNGEDWLVESALQPDSSVDKRKLALLYYQHPDRWDKAFSFLKGKDLAALDTGRYEIDGLNVYAIVTSYFTRGTDEVNFEAHRTYTDVHIVASGTEYIECGDTTAPTVVQPYDLSKDVAMLQVDATCKLLAKPGSFFIFSPGVAHRPYLKVDKPVEVKKIILKIKTGH